MADSRAELLQQIQEQKREFIAGIADSNAKKFVLANKANFVAPNRYSMLYRMAKNGSTTMQQIIDEMHWPCLGIFEITQKQLCDLLYQPTEAVPFRRFRELIASGDGTASAVFFAGKKAVLLTNQSKYHNTGDYRIVKSMGGSVPDIIIVPWYSITGTNIIVTEV